MPSDVVSPAAVALAGVVLNVAVVMDPIGSIKTAKDSTFALLLEAQRRGHRLHYIRPGGLGLANARTQAHCAPLQVHEDSDPSQRDRWHTLDDFVTRPLSGFDVVLMRTDPPVDAAYLHDTQILSLAQREGVLVVNDPRGLRDLNEKLAAFEFPQCCPPTLVSRDAAALRAFVAAQGEAVLKPLDGMGGRSIFRASAGDPNLNVILETLLGAGYASHGQLVMAQR